MPLEINLRWRGTQQDTILPLLSRLRWRDSCRAAYAERLGLLSVEPLGTSLQLQDGMTLLTGHITQAAETAGMGASGRPDGREPWWDWECARERRKSFAMLNLYRLTNSRMSRNVYLELNSRFKRVCKEKAREFYGGLATKFANARDASEFWCLVRSLRPGHQRRMGDISMTSWVQHFKAQWSLPEGAVPSLEYRGPLVTNETMDRLFTLEELKIALAKAKINKAPGPDQIAYEFYKSAPDSFLLNLLALFNRAYELSAVPASFGESIVYPLFKKGNLNLVSDYRGLSFINCSAKLYCALLLARLEIHFDSERILNENQCGF